MTPLISEVSRNDFFSTLKAFTSSAGKLPKEEFEKAYDSLVAFLQEFGSFSEGGLESADFASSRYVPPIRCINLTLGEAHPDVEKLIMLGSSALQRMPRPFCIVYDIGLFYLCVYSDGRIFKTLDE